MLFGVLLILVLIAQVVSGSLLTLSTYSPFIQLLGPTVSRFCAHCHNIGSSLIFVAIYLHVIQKLLRKGYNKYATPWFTGVFMMILMIIISFLGQSVRMDTRGYHGLVVMKTLLNNLHITHFTNLRAPLGVMTVKVMLVLHVALAWIVILFSIPHMLLIFSGTWQKKTQLLLIRYFNKRDIYQMLFGIVLLICAASVKLYLGAAIEAAQPVWYIMPFYMVLICVANPVFAAAVILCMFCSLFMLPLGVLFRNSRAVPTTRLTIYTMLCVVAMMVPSILHHYHFSYEVVRIIGLVSLSYYFLYMAYLLLCR